VRSHEVPLLGFKSLKGNFRLVQVALPISLLSAANQHHAHPSQMQAINDYTRALQEGLKMVNM